MKQWEWSTIGDCCDLTSGGTPSKHNPNFWKGDLPFVSARDLKFDRIHEASLHISHDAVALTSTKIAPVGSLLMLVRGMGLANGIQVGEVTSPVAFNQDIRAIHPPRNIVPRFLLLALQSSFLNGDAERVLSSAAHGTLKIDTDALRRIAIPVPPFPEQQRIVGILDEAFVGIATAKTNAEKNFRNAREVFERVVTGRFTSVSTHWHLKQIREVCDFEGGSQPPKSEFVYEPRRGYVRFLQIRDYGSEKHVTYIPESKKNRVCKADDVMIGRYGASVGKILTGLAGAYNVALIKTLPDLTLVRRRFLYYYLISTPFQDQLLGVAARSAQAGFGKEDIFPFKIPVPSVNEQDRAVEELDALAMQSEALESLYHQKIAALDALKKSLLHQAFSGQLSQDKPNPVVELKPLTTLPVTIPGISTTDLHAGILAIACERHEAAGKLSDFTHVKAEKIAHMVEARLGIDLGRNPVKDAAGPNDFNHLKKVEHRARMANHFDFKQVKGGAYRVTKLGSFERLINKTREALGDRLAEVETLLEWMLPMNVRQAEIVATVYAAWNNLMLDGQKPTDEEIVRESRENWHPEKLKIDRKKFFVAVQWLRDQGVVPEGKGKPVFEKAGRRKRAPSRSSRLSNRNA